ncbi:hypothetical protein COT97_02135 [Candidatus Falkowbacteria bacterium CG10_big_fil_rev_8_21_14_0_10_39_11]|uniref:Uncharacterized protein n=1 Tax=Candidatus Falkowbacteria bacterium CG10_big_fil_rev_8_21_14_0_10_39_11 TaxID=1974565 RepID=A0A2H0V5C3_9BACT|nr:MAG: hypothetical protein COT97_02135 [Candidatus Falkowbacteria bacterium CG10_big_fil_rev_8_21_14_0_10_39_11]
MITVLVDEEYGYRSWIWHFDGTIVDLIRWWQGLNEEDTFFYKPSRSLKEVNGREFDEVEHDELHDLIMDKIHGGDDESDVDYVLIHMHERDDSSLYYFGKFYYPGSDKVWEPKTVGWLRALLEY